MAINDWLNSLYEKAWPPVVLPGPRASEAPPAPPPPPRPLVPQPPVLGCSTASWQAYEGLLKIREGCSFTVYKDTLGKLTVGIGHLVLPGDGLTLGQTISQAEVDILFRRDAGNAMLAAVSLCKQAGIASQEFLPYMASVCFQLGDDWPTKFPGMWALVLKGDYVGAAADAGSTAWAKETPVRVADWQGALRALPRKEA